MPRRSVAVGLSGSSTGTVLGPQAALTVRLIRSPYRSWPRPLGASSRGVSCAPISLAESEAGGELCYAHVFTTTILC